MSIAGKLAVIASFIISTSVKPGISNPNTVAVACRGIVLTVTQDGNSSAALTGCLTLETQMIEIVQIMTGSRP